MVTVRVRAEGGGSGPRGAVVLEVEDDGPGLSPDQMAGAARRKRGLPLRTLPDLKAGHGLGLAIAAEIAALFRADIQFQAGSGGKGLLATIRLPPYR